MLASYKGHLEVVRVLLTHSDVDLNLQNKVTFFVSGIMIS